MGPGESSPTRRAVLESAGKYSGSLLVTGAVMGSAVADHRTSGCQHEPGLQGQVPLQDQPNRADAYCRNIELVGHNSIENRGANYDMVWYGNYAYLTTVSAGDPNDGTAVIDASNPEAPKVTTILNRNPFECMTVSEPRDLLIFVCGEELVIYDLSDPAHPDELSTTDLPISGVIPALSPDDTIVYITRSNPFITEDVNKARRTADPGMAAIDISDPLKANVVATHPDDGHAPGISLDGKKLYLCDHGVTVYDISEIQQGEDTPQFERMGHYHTFDIPQRGPTFRRNGREYFVTQDETDGDGKRVRPEGGVSIGGGCPWGIVRFYDVTDGSNPRKAGEFKLEVNENLNCPRTQKDGSLTPGPRAAFNFYSPHYGEVHTTDDPNAAFFSWNASGLRVVDIRDLQNPTEIAYYNPPPNPTTDERCNTWACTNEFVDAVESRVRYRPDSGHIWFASVSNGFHIAELTGGASDIPK